jgi:hypothetical protein
MVGEMNARTAAEWVKRLRVQFPNLRFKVWHIAQGLAYVVVDGTFLDPEHQLSLRTEDEARFFLRNEQKQLDLPF